MNSKNENEVTSTSKCGLLIGVNRYLDKGISDLRCPVSDVTALSEIFTSKELGRFEAIQVLTDKVENELNLPSSANIRENIRSAARASSEEDFLVVYFSGHGLVENDESYLVPRDARLGTLEDTAIPLQWVKNEIRDSNAKFKLLILDACHAGAQIGKEGIKAMAQNFAKSIFENSEGLAILSSCKRNEFSWEFPGGRNSVFTYYLMKGLEGEADYSGDGAISLLELNRYVFETVQRWALQNNRQQTPTFQGELAGDISITNVPIKRKRMPESSKLKISKDTELVTSFYLEANGLTASIQKDATDRLMGQILMRCESFEDIIHWNDKGDNFFAFPYGVIRSRGTSSLEIHFCKLSKQNYSQANEVLSAVKAPWSELAYILRCKFELKSTLQSLKKLNATVAKYDASKQAITTEIEGWGRDGIPAKVVLSNHYLGSRVRITQRNGKNENFLEENIHRKLSITEFCTFLNQALKSAQVTDMSDNYPTDWFDKRNFREVICIEISQQYPILLKPLLNSNVELTEDNTLIIKLMDVPTSLKEVFKEKRVLRFFESLSNKIYLQDSKTELYLDGKNIMLAS